MKIEIVKQRRKTVVLSLKNSEYAVLKVPKSYSQTMIDKFLSQKSSWLEKASKKLAARETFSLNFDFEKYLYVDGKVYCETRSLSKNYDSLSSEQKNKLVENFYRKKFCILEQLAYQKSAETGLSFDSIKPLKSNRTWGSYSVKRVMKLNYKLVILPQKLAAYVVYHELCHSVQMNHQPKFWNEVHRFCADYQLLKAELKNFAFVLQTSF